MVPEELISRLHELGDVCKKRAADLTAWAEQEGRADEPGVVVGAGAVRDDGLFLHSLADVLAHRSIEPAYSAQAREMVESIAAEVGRRYEEGRT
jgi:hypothetical protein